MVLCEIGKSAEGMMGYHADEVIGSSNRKFFVEPEEANKIMDLVLREGKIKNYRAIMLRKDGEPVYISMSAALLRDKMTCLLVLSVLAET